MHCTIIYEKMKINEEITHRGLVTEINKNTIKVRLIDDIHCSTCSLKSSCGLAEASDKVVDIKNFEKTYRLNQVVELSLESKTGLKAVVLAYVVPFLLFFNCLLVSVQYINELQAGILSFMILILYYVILSFLNKRLEEYFSISITKTI